MKNWFDEDKCWLWDDINIGLTVVNLIMIDIGIDGNMHAFTLIMLKSLNLNLKTYVFAGRDSKTFKAS